jgi:hypothetical protein
MYEGPTVKGREKNNMIRTREREIDSGSAGHRYGKWKRWAVWSVAM